MKINVPKKYHLEINGLEELSKKIKEIQNLIEEINNTPLDVEVSYVTEAEESSKDKPNEKVKSYI